MIREQMNLDLDVEVASILRSRAAEAHVSEGEIVDRAIRAYDLRSLVARIVVAAVSMKGQRWRSYVRSWTPFAPSVALSDGSRAPAIKGPGWSEAVWQGANKVQTCPTPLGDTRKSPVRRILSNRAKSQVATTPHDTPKMGS